jgi:hypothetical protein
VLYPLDNSAPRTVPKPADGFAQLRWCPDICSLMVSPAIITSSTPALHFFAPRRSCAEAFSNQG